PRLTLALHDALPIYDASLEYVDTLLEEFMSFAQEPARARTMVVIITADHGEGFGEHGTGAHGNVLYEEAVRIPWIIWGPGVVPRRYQTLVSLEDLMPTVLGFAGLPTPENLCGTNLVPALRKGEPPITRPIYLEILPDHTRDFFVVSYIADGYKFIYYPMFEAIELFELAADPEERHNLADDEPERVQAMLEALTELYEARGLDPAAYNLPEP